MALHELATNAGKYGALSDGRAMSRSPGTSSRTRQRRFELKWAERDGPHPQPPQRKGFGHTVLVDMVEHELGARVRLEYAGGVLTWSFPRPPTPYSKSDRRGCASTNARADRRGRVSHRAGRCQRAGRRRLRDRRHGRLGRRGARPPEHGCDAAVLDANLKGTSAEPVAKWLRDRGIPFLVVGLRRLPARGRFLRARRSWRSHSLPRARQSGEVARETHRLRRSALAITETEDRLMASAATIGDSRRRSADRARPRRSPAL